jgi:Cu(I)/Ag(I) efflux system membrane protein CusA/SilA
LIRAAIDTLRHTLLEEMIVVSLVIFVFLLHARSALIPILTIPIGIALAFVPMLYQGLNANIMSLGGIAVAIGAMVDAAIIVVENVHKRLEGWEAAGYPGERAEVILRAMQEVGPSIFFALLVITVSFLPIFALEGTEGRLFKPLAFTKTYAMGFAAVLSVTLTPALAALLIRGRIRGEHDNPINRWLVSSYAPVVRFVVRRERSWWSERCSCSPPQCPRSSRSARSSCRRSTRGRCSTCRPRRRDLDRRGVADPAEHGPRAARGARGRARVRQDRARRDADGSRAALDGRDVVQLAPREKWRPGLTWDALVAELDKKLRYPGMPNLWWMPIQTRTEMLATGVRSQLGVKIFGDDLAQVEQAAIAIAQALSSVPGTRNAFAERATGAFYLDVAPDRARAARYGVSVEDVNTALEAAIGGTTVSQTVAAGAVRDPGPLCARLSAPIRRPWDARSSRRRAARSCRCARSRISRSRTARTWCAAKPASCVGLVASTSRDDRSSTT